MTRTKGPLRWAGIALAVGAVLYVVGLVLGGGSNAVTLLIYAALHAVLAYGLIAGKRWVGYFAFLFALIGISVAVAGIWSTGPVPGWVFTVVTASNIVAAALLFVALWRPVPAETAH